MNAPFTSRRTVLAAAGTVSLAAAVTACGGSDDGGGDGGTGGASPGTGQETGGSTQPDEGGGAELAEVSEIPEGGGKILKEEKVVVTQPSAGEYKAFSAVCTHQGCLVTSVGNGTIDCACHGSRFDIADGSVTRGPAQQALPPVNVSVEGGSIRKS
ncbi:Rieske (2Fe-2S) protein [Streptomyces sp. JJ36]|uniref:Rieske (2Fe-2S) protein n=1 Tax=Streptomyces sp. JJ36 TaxID=2736645 RepID=UPI001F16A2E4|nr:Rieske (2Fe-2S) protein [Streptomyces sp. JJ36]MCF6524336.1 Rieske (2Fe-2S) protein [Streptomyces sp. JJ36]